MNSSIRFSVLQYAIAGATALVAWSGAVYGFGTVTTLGQHREHEMVTRTALDCRLGDAAFPKERAFAKEGLCFQPVSLDEIAGTSGSFGNEEGAAQPGTFGAVGAPDNPVNRELDRSEVHCDNSKLQECRTYMNEQMVAAVRAARELLTGDSLEGALNPDALPTTFFPCAFQRQVGGRAKCNVLEHLGSVLHAAQDFYSHSNWADQADPNRPLSPSNPPGLNKPGPAPFLDIRQPSAAIPPGLISGCFIQTSATDTRGNSKCGTAPSHEDLNKDKGIIEPALFNRPNDPTLTTAATPRGMIGTNFHKAIESAALDTRDKIRIFRERLIAFYGDRRGALMFCAITNDDPANTCHPSDVEVRSRFDLATPFPAAVVGNWIYRDYDPKGKDKPGGYTTTFEISKDGTTKAADGGTGKVTSFSDNEIKIEATNGAYKMTITWDPRTAIGQILFSDAPNDSPKKKDKGPYDISMRRN